MSSAVISTSAAHGRPFIFDTEELSELEPVRIPCFGQSSGDRPASKNQQSTIPSTLNRKAPIGDFLRTPGVTSASQLSVRPAPEMVSSGIAAVDVLTGGLPRGCLTELCGPASSGRTTVLLAVLSAATRRGEFCVLIDASDTLDPLSAAAAGVELNRLLWVRCGEHSTPKAGSSSQSKSKNNYGQNADWRKSENRLEQVLHATDLLLESGGFGVVALDLADLPPQAASRIPLATWFRFRRTVESTPTVLLAVEQQPSAGSCSSLLIQLAAHEDRHFSGEPVSFEHTKKSVPEVKAGPSHTFLLGKIEITAEVLRSRLERKAVGSAAITFASRTAWADEKAG